jgi:hypothetical protein
MYRMMTATLMVLVLLVAADLRADNFSGKITLVQVNSNGTRFFISGKNLSLFAPAEPREVLLQAFFKKAPVDVGYTVIACPGGITGTCGNVNFVNVNAVNIP